MAIASFEEAAERTWAHVVERAQVRGTGERPRLWIQRGRLTDQFRI